MNNTIRTTLTIAALAVTVSAPVSIAQADSKIHGIYDINNATDHPYEIDGKNVFEINRELLAQRKLAEKTARTQDADKGVVVTPKKRSWFQRHFKPAKLQQS